MIYIPVTSCFWSSFMTECKSVDLLQQACSLYPVRIWSQDQLQMKYKRSMWRCYLFELVPMTLPEIFLTLFVGMKEISLVWSQEEAEEEAGWGSRLLSEYLRFHVIPLSPPRGRGLELSWIPLVEAVKVIRHYSDWQTTEEGRGLRLARDPAASTVFILNIY